jgi:ribonuclease VapC
MIENVLDASAVLAVLQNEPGKEKVEIILDQSAIGRINVTEILTSLINKGATLQDAVAAIDSLELPVIEFDKTQAERTAELRPITKHLGLSLGDRACLALAIQENATAVTADRNWADLDVCMIEVIR